MAGEDYTALDAEALRSLLTTVSDLLDDAAADCDRHAEEAEARGENRHSLGVLAWQAGRMAGAAQAARATIERRRLVRVSEVRL